MQCNDDIGLRDVSPTLRRQIGTEAERERKRVNVTYTSCEYVPFPEFLQCGFPKPILRIYVSVYYLLEPRSNIVLYHTMVTTVLIFTEQYSGPLWFACWWFRSNWLACSEFVFLQRTRHKDIYHYSLYMHAHAVHRCNMNIFRATYFFFFALLSCRAKRFLHWNIVVRPEKKLSVVQFIAISLSYAFISPCDWCDYCRFPHAHTANVNWVRITFNDMPPVRCTRLCALCLLLNKCRWESAESAEHSCISVTCTEYIVVHWACVCCEQRLLFVICSIDH